MIAKFEPGRLIYLYYDYIKEMHVIPGDIADLFEFLEFRKVQGRIKEYIYAKSKKN